MAEEEGPTVQPLTVSYDPITGVPSEFNQYLPKDCDEYRRWKSSQEAGVTGELAGLALADGGGGGGGGVAAATAAAAGAAPSSSAAAAAEPGVAVEAAAAAPAEKKKSSSSGGSKKGKGGGAKPEVVLERNTRNKKKCITTIQGLDGFGIKLGEAAKFFGKKFACGASVGKSAEGKEYIDVQGDFLDQAAELIVKQYKEVVQKGDVFYIDAKKKQRFFDVQGGEDD